MFGIGLEDLRSELNLGQVFSTLAGSLAALSLECSGSFINHSGDLVTKDFFLGHLGFEEPQRGRK